MIKKEEVSLWGAVGIGIGGMVGGGIFAVLGLAVTISKGGTPLAFLAAGIIATITAFSYAKLSLAYPSEGGTVTFINKGFGQGIFSGGTNNLLWISYVIMLALYASAFGSYTSKLIPIFSNGLDAHVYSTGIILFSLSINYYSVKVVSKIETLAVGIKLIILLSFVAVGLYGLTQSNHLANLSFNQWPSMWNLTIGGMVIFVAYEGMELIANVSPNIENPQKNMVKAYMYATVFVVILYVVIAIITVGSLSFSAIKTAQDYALAEAAKPMLGQVGFTIIGVAAMISTFSAINASLYGGSRVNYTVAQDHELPHEFTKLFKRQPIGLLVISILTILLVNTLNLNSISTSGSAGFLLIFLLVNYVAFKKCKEISIQPTLPLIGAILCLLAFLGLIYQQFSSNLVGTFIALGIICSSYLIEYIYKKTEKTTYSR